MDEIIFVGEGIINLTQGFCFGRIYSGVRAVNLN